MGSLFKPKAPKVQEPEVTPLPDEDSPAVRRRMQAARARLRGQRGYRSTMVSGQLGDSSTVAGAAPMLVSGAATLGG